MELHGVTMSLLLLSSTLCLSGIYNLYVALTLTVEHWPGKTLYEKPLKKPIEHCFLLVLST